VLKLDADEDGVGGDDAADALGYLVATRGRTVAQRKLRVVWLPGASGNKGAAGMDGQRDGRDLRFLI